MKVHPTRRLRRGFALLLVIVQMTLLIALWGVACRQLDASMRFIASLPSDEQGSSSDVGLKPLTRALILLETGDPPADVYSCGVTVPGPNNAAIGFVVTFTKVDGAQGGTQWTVNSKPADPDLSSYNLPTMPYSFQ